MAYLGQTSLPFDPTRSLPVPRDADRFSGNGSTTSFTLSRSVNAAVDIEVFVENVQQEPLTAYDVNGTSLNFTGAPPSGTNNVYVVYRNFQSGAQVTMPDGSVTYSKLANNLRIFTTDNLTPNGNNSVFTLSEPPADANTVMVTVDGIIQRAPVHYTTSGSTITFTSAPAAGSNVHVRHLGFRTSTTVTQLAANSTISQPTITSPVVSGGTLNSVTRIGVGVAANTSYGIYNRYFGNSEIATQYGTGTISGVGAYATNGGVFIDNGTTKVYPMLWDGSGRVTKPYQPMVLVGKTVNQTIAHNTFTKITFNNIINETGSPTNFNTSTNRFTAPVAGWYIILCHLYIYPTAQAEAYIYKNGTSSDYMRAAGTLSSGNVNPNGYQINHILYLNASDYIEIYAWQYQSSGTGNAEFYYPASALNIGLLY